MFTPYIEYALYSPNDDGGSTLIGWEHRRSVIVIGSVQNYTFILDDVRSFMLCQAESWFIEVTNRSRNNITVQSVDGSLVWVVIPTETVKITLEDLNTSNYVWCDSLRYYLGNVQNVVAGGGLSFSGRVLENTDRGSVAVGLHEAGYDHGLIAHSNRRDLDSVSGTNTGDQNLSSYVKVFDNRLSPYISGSVASGGGVGTGSILLDLSLGETVALSIEASGDTRSSDIEFFTDSGLTDSIYSILGVDCFSSPHVDMAPWACFSLSNDLEGSSLHYSITNSGGSNSTYEIKLVVFGKE